MNPECFQVTNYNLTTLNCRGAKGKLDLIIQELKTPKLKQHKPEVCCLQEVSFNQSDEQFWSNKLGWKNVFINGGENSRGVAIAFSSELDVKTDTADRFADGHCLIWKGRLNGLRLIIVNVHAPNAIGEQIVFFKEVQHRIKLHETRGYSVCLLGDFNVTLETKDIISGSKARKSRSIEILSQILDNYELVDSHRTLHQQPCFTWRCNNIARRLDYIFIPKTFSANVKYSKIIDCPISDHDMVFLRLESEFFVQRGRGTLKLNTSHLNHDTYCTLINETIDSQLEQTQNYTNKRLKWDFLKFSLMETTRKYSIKKAREKREQIETLKIKIEEARTEFAEQVDEETVRRLNQVEGQLSDLLKSAQEGSRLRARCNWMARGERNSKFFFGLEKSYASQKTITQLKGAQGRIKDWNNVQSEIKEHFVSLYSARPEVDLMDQQFDQFLRDPQLTQLSPEDRGLLEREISIEEIGEALKNTKTGKSPGVDGIPYEFYSKFWDKLKVPFMECVQECFNEQQMSTSQRRAAVTLLPKPLKDPETLNGYRGISLLCCDYKIMSGVFANRLKKVLPNIIAEEQTGFIKGRQIGESIRIVKDVAEYLEQNDLPGYLLCADLKQAFDSISYQYVDAALKAFNFPDYFCQWIRILRTDSEKCVMNNGHSTGFFNISRGCAQGDPISPYLFIICLETLANAIKRDNDIHGITVEPEQVEFKAVYYADDSSFTLRDKESIKKVLEKFELFEQCSGLELSKPKTIAKGLGQAKELTEVYENIEIKPQPVRLLGYMISDSQEEEEDLNFVQRLPKLKKTLSNWIGRGLTLKGRTLIAKTLGMSQMIFSIISGVAGIKTKKKIDDILLDFLWEHRKAKLKRAVLIQDYADAGLKFPCIYSIYSSLKCKWLKRLQDSVGKKWSFFFHREAILDGGIEKILQSNYRTDRLNGKYNSFYKDVLDEFSQVSAHVSRKLVLPSGTEIAQQSLLNNQWVHQKKRSFYVEEIHDADSFLDWWDNDEKRLKRLDEINNMITNPISQITYSALKRSIPPKWIKEAKTETWQNNPLPIIQLDWTEIKSEKISRQLVAPSAVEYWNRHLVSPNMGLLWCSLIQQNYLHYDPKVYNNQYKLLHNLIITRRKLCIFNSSTDPTYSDKCPSCRNEVHDICHVMIHCPKTDQCWKAFNRMLQEDGATYRMSDNEKALGIITDGDPFYRKMETLAAIVRLYIVLNHRDDKTTCHPDGMKLFVRYKLKIQRLTIQNPIARESFVQTFSTFM